MSERTIVWIMGLIAGILVCCVTGMLAIAVAPAAPKGIQREIPSETAIEAAISEEYLNRVISEAKIEGPMGMALKGSRLDVRPGGLIRYIVQFDTPFGLATVRGVSSLVARRGRLEIGISEVRMGQMPLTPLVRPILASLESQINDEINRELAARTARPKVRLVAVTSDDHHLRLYFASQ